MIRQALVVAVLLLSATALTQERGNFDISSVDVEELEKRLVAIRDELNLTDEQIDKITPILTTGAEERLEFLEENQDKLASARSSGRPNLRALRSIRQGLRKIDNKTDDGLAEVLDKDQMKAYKKIRDDMRDELRDRARQR